MRELEIFCNQIYARILTKHSKQEYTFCVCPAYAGHTPKAFQIVQKYKFSFTNQVFGVLFFQRVQVPYERIETPNR